MDRPGASSRVTVTALAVSSVPLPASQRTGATSTQARTCPRSMPSLASSAHAAG